MPNANNFIIGILFLLIYFVIKKLSKEVIEVIINVPYCIWLRIHQFSFVSEIISSCIIQVHSSESMKEYIPYIVLQ